MSSVESENFSDSEDSIESESSIEVELDGSRFSYIHKIEASFNKVNKWLLPNAEQERAYEEALTHLVHILSANKDFVPSNCTKSRKERLKGIFYSLQEMQRKRLYDPPADREIRYYLVIKKYIRSFISFFTKKHIDAEKFMYFSPLEDLSQMVRLMELNEHLAGLSEAVSELDFPDGSTIKPSMVVRDNEEVVAPPVTYGSKEKTNKFYHHKFYLAQLDLHSSELAFCPPHPEEMQYYLQVLDHLSSSSLSLSRADDAVSAYSDELCDLFLERIESEMSEMQILCTSIVDSLAEKLSLTDWRSTLNYPVSKLRSKLAEKCCRVETEEELRAHIERIDRCSQALCETGFFSDGHMLDTYTNWVSEFVEKGDAAGWAALHCLTLLKGGPPEINRTRATQHKTKRMMNIKQDKEGEGENDESHRRTSQRKRKRMMNIKQDKEGEGENDESHRKTSQRKRKRTMNIKQDKEGEGENDESHRRTSQCKRKRMMDECVAQDGVKIRDKIKWVMSKCVAQDETKWVMSKCVAQDETKWVMSKCVAQDETKWVMSKCVAQDETKWVMSKCVAQEGEGENENVKLLKGIIEALKLIGDSTVEPDREEKQLMNKILQNVAASVNFSTCAMAYEQRYRIYKNGRLPHDMMHGLRTGKRRKTSVDVNDLLGKLIHLFNYVTNFMQVAGNYHFVVIEKLAKLPLLQFSYIPKCEWD